MPFAANQQQPQKKAVITSQPKPTRHSLLLTLTLTLTLTFLANPAMKSQPANISPLWFFTKVAILCALCVAVVMQGFAILRKDNTVKAPVARKASEAKPTPPTKNSPAAPAAKAEPQKIEPQKTDVTLPKTRAQVRQELAEMVKKGLQNAIKKPAQTPLAEALLDTKTYDLIKSDIIHNLDGPYGKLYTHLGLDNSQLQELRGLLADKELGMMEGFALAREAKTPLDSDSLNSLRNEPDEAIHDLLGDDAFAYYKDYESTLGARNHVDALEQRLSYQTEPLTDDQYNALVTALAEQPDQGIKPGSGAWMGSYNPDITKESLEIARGILTPSQFAVYESEYENLQNNIEITEKYSQQFANAEKNQRAGIKSKLKHGKAAP